MFLDPARVTGQSGGGAEQFRNDVCWNLQMHLQRGTLAVGVKEQICDMSSSAGPGALPHKLIIFLV